ncbi:MAG: hypothetical protein GY765_12445 [bacterium]|nr:hypothetical protein [bacterium]
MSGFIDLASGGQKPFRERVSGLPKAFICTAPLPEDVKEVSQILSVEKMIKFDLVRRLML